MFEAFDCLSRHGQRLDLEIARETGMPLEDVRKQLLALAATGAVIACRVTRVERGLTRVRQNLQCRSCERAVPLDKARFM